MKITIKSNLKITPHEALKLANELVETRRKEGTFNYSLMTKGIFDRSPIEGLSIQVKQKMFTNRKNDFSHLEIIIEQHYSII